MRGQWVGAYAGSNSGLAIVDIDEVGGQFRGYAYMFDSNQGLPNIRADLNMRVPGEIISKLASRCYLCTGCAGGGAPAAAVVWGMHGLCRARQPQPAAKNAHVDLRQPDCRALTVSGPVGDFAYRRAMGRRVCRQDDP